MIWSDAPKPKEMDRRALVSQCGNVTVCGASVLMKKTRRMFIYFLSLSVARFRDFHDNKTFRRQARTEKGAASLFWHQMFFLKSYHQLLRNQCNWFSNSKWLRFWERSCPDHAFEAFLAGVLSSLDTDRSCASDPVLKLSDHLWYCTPCVFQAVSEDGGKLPKNAKLLIILLYLFTYIHFIFVINCVMWILI